MIIGTAAVVLLVSLGVGLQQNAEAQLGGIGDLTRVVVYPGFSEGPVVDIGPGGGSGQTAPLNQAAIDSIAALPGVTAVIPQDYFQSWAIIRVGRLEGGSSIIGVGTEDLSELGVEAAQGELTLTRGTVIIGSQVANNFYDPPRVPARSRPRHPTYTARRLTSSWSSSPRTARKSPRKRAPASWGPVGDSGRAGLVDLRDHE